MRRGRILPIAILGLTFGLVLLIVGAILLPQGPAPTPTPTPTLNPTPTLEYLAPGQPAQASGQLVTVSSPTRAHYYEYCRDGFCVGRVAAPAGKAFIIIQASVTNMGYVTAEGPLLPTAPDDFTLTDCEGNEYSGYSYGYPGGYPHHTRLYYTGESASGKIVFEVPQVAYGFQVSYDLGTAQTGPRVAIWSLLW